MEVGQLVRFAEERNNTKVGRIVRKDCKVPNLPQLQYEVQPLFVGTYTYLPIGETHYVSHSFIVPFR